MILFLSPLKDKHGRQYVARLAKWPLLEIIGHWDDKHKLFFPAMPLTDRDLEGIVKQLKRFA